MTIAAPSSIGLWASRPKTRAHLVESEIADRVVMRCGRQMPLRGAGGELVFWDNAGRSPCRQCTFGS